MPAPPRLTLPPTLLQRVEALRSAAPAGRPSRQAVVEAALARGLEALEGAQAGRGRTDGREGMGGAADASSGRVVAAVAPPAAAR